MCLCASLCARVLRSGPKTAAQRALNTTGGQETQLLTDSRPDPKMALTLNLHVRGFRSNLKYVLVRIGLVFPAGMRLYFKYSWDSFEGLMSVVLFHLAQLLSVFGNILVLFTAQLIKSKYNYLNISLIK